MEITITANVPEEQIKKWYMDCTNGAFTDVSIPWRFAADIDKLSPEEKDGKVFEVATKAGNVYLSTYCEKYGGFVGDILAFRPVPEVPKEFLDRCSSQTKQATSRSLPKEESSHA